MESEVRKKNTTCTCNQKRLRPYSLPLLMLIFTRNTWQTRRLPRLVLVPPGVASKTRQRARRVTVLVVGRAVRSCQTRVAWRAGLSRGAGLAHRCTCTASFARVTVFAGSGGDLVLVLPGATVGTRGEGSGGVGFTKLAGCVKGHKRSKKCVPNVWSKRPTNTKDHSRMQGKHDAALVLLIVV